MSNKPNFEVDLYLDYLILLSALMNSLYYMYLAFFILVDNINPNLYAVASLQFTYVTYSLVMCNSRRNCSKVTTPSSELGTIRSLKRS
jgi:hypothetical protein